MHWLQTSKDTDDIPSIDAENVLNRHDVSKYSEFRLRSTILAYLRGTIQANVNFPYRLYTSPAGTYLMIHQSPANICRNDVVQLGGANMIR